MALWQYATLRLQPFEPHREVLRSNTQRPPASSIELSPQAEKSAIAHNAAINKIFMSDPGLPGGQPFISVLDAIQGDGFNPLWREFQITFTSGHTPRQLTSDTEVADAAQSGEITIQATDEVYRCSVVGD